MQFSSAVTNISDELAAFNLYNEDGGDRFLQNADNHIQGYTMS
jgi:hypothetical protein